MTMPPDSRRHLSAHGKFGRMLTRCGCTRAWAARLMKLYRIWGELPAARAWAETSKRPVSSKQFSVDGAIRLVREYQDEKNGKAVGRATRARPSRLKEALAQLITAEQKLAAAKALIEFLESERSAAKPTAPEVDRQPLDPGAREKVAKVGAYWFRGSTHGERTSAVSRLHQIASRYGWPFRDLALECGLEM